MSSIRRFLVIVLAASITLFNFVAAIQGYLKGIEKTEQLLDKQLIQISELMFSLTSELSQKKLLQGYSNEDLVVQIWQENDELILRTENAPETAIAEQAPGFSYSNFNGYRWRTYVTRDETHPHWLMLAERADTRFILSEEVIITSVLPIVMGLPVLGILIWLIVGNGLGPLKRLAKELEQKKPQDLSPLDESNIPEELEQLVESTNSLLERLSNSFERERRFSGDAAHELRTPLSVIKIELFNLMKTFPEQKQVFDKINDSINRMVSLIEQLLTLYRISPEQFIAKFKQVDLEMLAQEVIKELFAKIDAKQQSIELESENLKIEADEFSIYTLLKNLIDNANKYVPEQGKILVEIKKAENCVELVVEDSGPGIPDNLYERIFDRFYRVDGDQHQSKVQGSGLGMSIVKHIVDLHNGTIHLSHSRFETGLRVQVKLPYTQV